MSDTSKLQTLLQAMWVDYCDLNPSAHRIYELFTQAGETVLNDHIALRTFNHPRLGIKSLAKVFEAHGFEAKNEYSFKEKKLYAKHWEHPDLSLPKIFISELELEKVSPFIRETMTSLIEKIPQTSIDSEKFSMSGRHWDMSHELYSKLAEESEYASWVAAFGFRPNHFTVNVNALKKFNDLTTLNRFVEEQGYQLNKSGGVIKGTPEQFLEQSSTMAKEIPVRFSDGTFEIPGCYYEFAKRYKLPDGQLYQGFVAASADKIFESTNKVRS
ncbi:MAG: 2-oxoadipate dioxygenase/decarboxylase family protein [Pseudobdellovibrionaceae bacterium]